MIAALCIAIAGVAVPAGLIVGLRTRPSVFPYTYLLFMKCFGIAGPLIKDYIGAKGTPNEYFKSAGRTTLTGAKRIRDGLVELDAVPTIATGLKELGYKSTVEVFVKRDYYKRPSPYTHPLQQPYVFLPGIPAKTFYDPSEFTFTKILEDNFDVIRQELGAVLADGAKGFKYYRNEFGGDEKYWNTYNLFFHGEAIDENCARVSRTTEILESLPRFEKNHIMFSALNPRSHIPRHVGPANGILRGHLPLIVPPGCRIKVGDDVREWEEGKVMVFDDSFWHEVWNDSDQLRIVLFMNFWHPCLSEEEISVLERFRAIMDREAPGAEKFLAAQGERRPHNLEGAVRKAG